MPDPKSDVHKFLAASLGAPEVGDAPSPDEATIQNITEAGGQVVDRFGIPMFSEVFSSPDGMDAFANPVPQALW